MHHNTDLYLFTPNQQVDIWNKSKPAKKIDSFRIPRGVCISVASCSTSWMWQKLRRSLTSLSCQINTFIPMSCFHHHRSQKGWVTSAYCRLIWPRSELQLLTFHFQMIWCNHMSSIGEKQCTPWAGLPQGWHTLRVVKMEPIPADIGGRGGVHPGQVHSASQGWHVETNNQSHSHSHWESQMNPTPICISLDCGRKLDKTPRWQEETDRLHTSFDPDQTRVPTQNPRTVRRQCYPLLHCATPICKVNLTYTLRIRLFPNSIQDILDLFNSVVFSICGRVIEILHKVLVHGLEKVMWIKRLCCFHRTNPEPRHSKYITFLFHGH